MLVVDPSPAEAEQPPDKESSKSSGQDQDGSKKADSKPSEPVSLDELVSIALSTNPTLSRLREESAAAWARVPQVEALPDPMIGANVFGDPIETAAGSQRANLMLSQMIPWLARLEAQGQQAAFEALASEQVAEAEALRIAGDVKAAWFQLYVLGRQIEINRANRELLESLIKTATALVGQGRATQADVLLGTLALSQLEEQLLDYQRQVASLEAEVNRLLNRPADTPIVLPESISPAEPDFKLEMLRRLAYENQPEVAAAELRTQATRWGLEVACLRRRPDVTVNFNWFFMDDNRPPSRVVEVGEDAWSLGAGVTIPLWENKYNAIHAEASHRHFAAHAAVEEMLRRYDARLRDLLEQARTAQETVTLYEETILPQARQTLDADLQSYGQPGGVGFDRVIDDFRKLLTLEVGYHRALGALGIAIARLEQATAADLTPEELSKPPEPAEQDESTGEEPADQAPKNDQS